MRNVILALLAASGLAMAGSAPAQAFGTHYPFCLQGDEFPGLSNCTFTSYGQCQASASGRHRESGVPRSLRSEGADIERGEPGEQDRSVAGGTGDADNRALPRPGRFAPAPPSMIC